MVWVVRDAVAQWSPAEVRQGSATAIMELAHTLLLGEGTGTTVPSPWAH